MAQDFVPLQPTDTLTASRFLLNDTHAALASNFEGTAFPTLNLFIGQQCYRSDEERMYILRSMSPNVWVISAKITQTALTREDADARYFRFDNKEREDLNLMGLGAGGLDAVGINIHDDNGSLRYRLLKDASHNFVINRYNSTGTYVDTPFQIVGAEPRVGSNKIWHAGNDGSGSGLDADLVRNTAPGTTGLSLLASTSVLAALGVLGLSGDQLISTGDIKYRYGYDVPNGWVPMNGLSIGDASSSATGRANADCEALFKHLWTQDVYLAVSGGRGASAQADWDAHKRITLPDARGRSLHGRDSMGTSAAGRLISAIMAWGGVDWLGGYGGAPMVTLAWGQMPYHSHSASADYQGVHSHGVPGGAANTSSSGTPGVYVAQVAYTYTDAAGSHTHNISVAYAGNNEAHQNMPPFLLVTILLKL